MDPETSGLLRQMLEKWVGAEAQCASGSMQQEMVRLCAGELADERRAKAFGITTENVSEVIEERSRLMRSIAPGVGHNSPIISPIPALLETLWYLWLPLAMQLAGHRQALGRPLIQGILGGQGTGKTTLARILTLILGHLGYRTLSLSIDDFYKTYAERQRLREQDPRLIWRGPPGTHDVDLGIEVLDQLRQATPPSVISVPRFDKSAWGGAGDRSDPEIVDGADIVLFEGWFVGVRPVDFADFDRAPAPILTDGDRAFARDMNERLRNYLPLWQRLDRLIVLDPVDYRLSLEWRKQAEHDMISTGKSGMSDAQIEEFVNYFWKALHPELLIKPLVHNSALVDLVIEINPDHSIGSVYQP